VVFNFPEQRGGGKIVKIYGHRKEKDLSIEQEGKGKVGEVGQKTSQEEWRIARSVIEQRGGQEERWTPISALIGIRRVPTRKPAVVSRRSSLWKCDKEAET